MDDQRGLRNPHDSRRESLRHAEGGAVRLLAAMPPPEIECSLRLDYDMKTAYELAMERLSKDAPTIKLTDEQKRQLAELDTIYAAKIAERELLVKSELAKAEAADDYEAIQQLEKQLASDRKSLLAEKEEKKEQIRLASRGN